MQTIYANNADISIADTARIRFYEVIDNERILVTSMCMNLDMLESLQKAIEDTLKKHRNLIVSDK